MNDWGDPVSRRARQLNRDVAKTPPHIDNRVVNMAPSIVTPRLIKSGSCSGMRGTLTRSSWSNGMLGAWFVWYRISESRELGRAKSGRKGSRVEAKVSQRIDLEYRAIGIFPRG